MRGVWNQLIEARGESSCVARCPFICESPRSASRSLPALSEEPLSPAAQRGFVLMRTHCARCHSLDKVTDSPLKAAPPFRTLHERYPVESLEESLAEGIITGHPTMPEFRFDPGQVADVIAYLKSLER
jgi:mono/diheme cytochrome c family protein